MTTELLSTDLIGQRLAERVQAAERFFDRDSERIATLCHRMAERFARGGRLVALAASPAARSDARHVAVEFVHPVIVGKRALPALALTREGGPVVRAADLLLRPTDIVMAFGDGVEGACELARARGCLTVAFGEARAEWVLEPPSDDPFVRQELTETLYHVLWELVHVYFEHRGLLEGRQVHRVHDSGASSFLYPFLAEQEHDLDAVVSDVARSARMKARETSDLREQTLCEGGGALCEAAEAIAHSLGSGGKLLALGNGGSATDAMDLVADFRCPPNGWPSRAALDLTEDAAILTAVANDIGAQAMFSRQVIAYAQEGDVVLAVSTSGNSANAIEALEQARRQRVKTVAMVGYDGGRIAAERLAEHVIVTRSQHIPRIQEAQASACHVLRELVEMAA